MNTENKVIPNEDDFEKFLATEIDLNISNKKTIERIQWYYKTYFKKPNPVKQEEVEKLYPETQEEKDIHNMFMENAKNWDEEIEDWTMDIDTFKKVIAGYKASLGEKVYTDPLDLIDVLAKRMIEERRLKNVTYGNIQYEHNKNYEHFLFVIKFIRSLNPSK